MDSPRTELILGGQKSGKSSRAERLALDWLQADHANSAVLIATGLPGDAEMAERIERHRQDRAVRAPGLQTVEAPLRLADAMHRVSASKTLVVVDCLTLWLTQLLMPMEGAGVGSETLQTLIEELSAAVREAPGPLVLVSNEIGLGVIPLGREVRGFVDALGLLNQAVAARCERVTLMAAGCPLAMKGAA
jgi:adenosylcobinamide kinase/adenosylcobinamide-phosphate guanylyltransferase